jgi:hypothetical protein
MRATAERLVKSFGSGAMVTLVRFDRSGFDPITSKATVVEQPHPISGVFLNRGPDLTMGGDQLYRDNRRVILPANGLPVDPIPGDAIDWPGEGRWTVTDVKTAAPDGQPIYHDCSVRREAA